MGTCSIREELTPEVSAKNILTHIRKLISFGLAWAGSKAEHKRAEYIQEKFKNMGLETLMEKFKTLCFQEIKSCLKIVEPKGKKLDCMALAFSPSTIKQGITAELEDVRYGKEADYRLKDVQGKIVLVKMKKMKTSFWRESCIASENGAIGMIIVNKSPWPIRLNLIDEDGLVPEKTELIPAVCISSTDEEQLLSNYDMRVQLKLKAKTERKTSINVRGLIKGYEFPEEKILLIAHMDTAGVPGANDNTAAVAILIELARIMSKKKPRRTIEFVLLGAEEVGLVGSKAYVRIHNKELKKIKGVLNLDCVGGDEPLQLIEESVGYDKKVIKTSERLNKLLLDVTQELGYKLSRGRSPLGYSDEGPFIKAGVEATWLCKDNPRFFHSFKDIPDTINPDDTKVVANVSALTSWQLANIEKNSRG